jgi:hypothetical protein
MRNQKWNRFSHNDEEIPETWLEACIFLDNAINHLHNRNERCAGGTFDILIAAHEMVRETRGCTIGVECAQATHPVGLK